MDKLKIKFSTQTANFEIEAEKIDNGDKEFLEKIVGLFNKSASMQCASTEQYINKEIQNESQLTNNESTDSKVETETEKEQTNSAEETESILEEEEEEKDEEKETNEHNVVEEEQSANTGTNPFPHSVDLLGVKVRQDSSYGYQTYYVCPMCKNKGKRFAGQHDKFVFCHTCNFRMNKVPATSTGFPETDSYGNYFVAGNFIPVGLDFKH